MKTFWINRSNWPSDTSEYVFLANAVLLVGRALYPETWNDFDPAAKIPGGETAVRKRSMMSIDFWKSPFNDRKKSVTMVKARQNGKETQAGRRLFLEGLQRFQGVKAAIVTEAEKPAGLRTAYRRKGGFGFHPIPRQWWQSENTCSRFEICQINTVAPADRAIGGTGEGFARIFVHRSDLEKLLAELAGFNARDQSRGFHKVDIETSVASRTQPLPRASDDAIKAFAAQLDLEGIPIRTVTRSLIDKKWDTANGAISKVESVTRMMTGKPKGRPKEP